MKFVAFTFARCGVGIPQQQVTLPDVKQICMELSDIIRNYSISFIERLTYSKTQKGDPTQKQT